MFKWLKKNVLKKGFYFFILLIILLGYFIFGRKSNDLHFTLNYEKNSKYLIENCRRDLGYLQKLTGRFYDVSYCVNFPIFENRRLNNILFNEVNSKICRYKKSNLKPNYQNDKFEFFSNYQTFSCGDDDSVSVQFQFLEKNLTKKNDFEFLQTYVFKNDKLVNARTFFKNTEIKNIVNLIRKKFVENNPKVKNINLEKAFPNNLHTLRNFVETENSIIFFYERGEVLPNNCKIVSVELEKSLINDYIHEKFKPKTKVENAVDSKPKVALTFDDGPDEDSTKEILDVLKENGAKATFFVLGEKCKENPELLKRMVEEEHEIGNHTYSHVNLKSASERKINEEIEKTNSLIASATGGYRPNLVRPPGGFCNKKIKNLIDYPLILWSVDTMDWNHKNADRTIDKVLKLTRDGSIILMHDIYKESAEAVKVIVPKLIEKGFDLVTVSNLFDSKDADLEPHNSYYNVKNFDLDIE